MALNSVPGIALIIGAASGIGRDTAYSFAEAGVSGIVFADYNEAGAQETAEQCKKFAKNALYRGLVVAVDVTKPASVQEMVDTTVNQFGRIDYCVNSAGHGHDTHLPITEATVEEFDVTHNVNSRGTFLVLRAVTKAMQAQEPLTITSRSGERSIGRGSIVNMGSANSYVAAPGTFPYVASKFAVMGMTKSAALDCASSGIRVNAVCASWVDTPMVQEDLKNTPGLKQFIEGAVPIGRMAVPEEVSDYVVFLCSPSASYITGTGLLIDAGVTLTLHTG